MAITKILTIHDCGEKFAGKHLKRAIEYITTPEKTQDNRYVAGMNCQPQDAFVQMKSTKQSFGKTDKRQGYHIIISFEEEKLEPGIAFEIVGKFVKEFLGSSYEAIYAVHDNTEHTHGHIIFNSVSFLNGKKFRYEKGDWAKKMQPITNRLCEEYGLSTIDIEMEGVGKNEYYKDWNDFRDGTFIWRDMIRRDLDACVIQADSFMDFMEMLKSRGYEIKQKKYLAVKPPGMQRFCRCKSLGDNYTEDMLRKRIMEEDIRSYAARDMDEYVLDGPKDEFLRRTKLTGIQKTYYAKICRIRRLEKLPYSKAWQFRGEIRKMQECHEQYLFLVKNDIHSLEELVAVRDNLKSKQKECQKERTALYREKKRFAPLFEMADRLKELQPAQNSFLQGDTFFEEEHQEYEKVIRELAGQGYSRQDVEQLRRFCEAKLSGNYVKRQAVGKDIKIADGMVKELTDAMARREQERQLEQKDIEKKMEEKQPKR